MKYLAVLALLVVALTQPVAAQMLHDKDDPPLLTKGLNLLFDGNHKEALKILRPLAEQNNAKAQYWMGAYHATVPFSFGSFPKDNAIAMKWWRMGSFNGSWYSMVSLGQLYEKGEGVLQDLVMAYVWYNVAAAHNSPTGPTLRDEVAKKLSKKELSQAHSLSKLCFKSQESCPKYSN